MLIILIILTLLSSTSSRYCATQRDDTLYIYPSENNCSSFIVCYHNEEYEMSCLQASLFMYTNERLCLEACPVVETKRRTVTKASYEFTLDHELFPAEEFPSRTILCPSTGTSKASIPQQCTEYILCEDGIGRRVKCENGTKFSPTKFECVSNEESDCLIKKLKGSPNKKCRFEKKGISPLIFPSENCSDFKKCSNLMAWTIRCAQYTNYSKEKRSCEWENEVKCGK